MPHQQAHLPPHRPWAQLTEAGQETGKRPRAAGVLGGERLAREFAQDVVRELGGVELLEEDGEELGDGLGEVLIVLQGLHERDLGMWGVSVVLGGEAEELVDSEFDGGMFEVGGGLEEVVSGAGYAATKIE